MRRMILIQAALLAAMFGIAMAPAHAQATRTWVSGVGDDANPCSRTAPCKTFAGAIAKTAAQGGINCLDPAGYGGVTITKSISIICQAGTAGVLVSGTNGITVSVAAAVVKDSLIINSVGGFNMQGAGGVSNGAFIRNSLFDNNSSFATQVIGPSTAFLIASALFGSPTAISLSSGGQLTSYGNNVIRNAGAPSSTLPLQ